MDDTNLCQQLAATGIGFAGMDGAWWLPAREPFVLPAAVAQQLNDIGPALFALLDAVQNLYAESSEVRALLDYKVPAHIPRLISPQRVESLRPDFQLCPTPEGYRLVATELEMCPSSHGWAHTMQNAYSLDTDVADAFAGYLDGRELLIVGTQHWSEFLIEQLAFCRALAERGAKARVLYDAQLEVMAREFSEGQRWQPPMFGISSRLEGWNDDLLSRLRANDLLQFSADVWPDTVGEAVIFRFGYFDCFASWALNRIAEWERRGARCLNPLTFFWESKAIMAAVGLPPVRAALSQQTLRVLEACLPETLILQSSNSPRLIQSKNDWVLKFAGFDSGQQAWGGRSLQIGAQHTQKSWVGVLAQYAALPFPVVAQRIAPTAQVDIEFVDARENVQVMRQGYTRLRTFFLRGLSPSPIGREGRGVRAVGSHLTISGGSMQVSESTDSVQAPVKFL
ncbi:MAG: hypothetical protein ACT4QE_07495 [Anaerolineales bacterium]